MDVFKIVVQLASSAIVVSVVPCGKKKDAKMKFAKGSKSLSASKSSTISKSMEIEKAHSKEKDGKPKGKVKPQPAAKKEETKDEGNGKLVLDQIHQIMEAEKMAKASKGYDNVDFDLDDVVDDKPAPK